MNVKEAIEKRRSVRKFKQIKIPDELIKELLESARLAPSGCNVQPWRYFLIKEKNVRKKLKEKGAFNQDFVYEAPLIIVCCGDPGEG